MTELFRSQMLVRIFAACSLAVTLAACGGGGSGGAGCTTIDPTRPNSLPGCGGGSTPDTPVTPGSSLAPVTLALTDSGGAAMVAVTPDKPGMVVATVKDSTGAVQSNVTVTLTSTDNTATFLPASGSALTDAQGVAKIGLPAGTSAGAFTITAKAVKASLTSTGTINYSVVLSNQQVVIAPLTLAMADSTGAAMTTVTPERSGTLAATVKDSTGVALANVAVSFSSSDKSAVFVPASGTTLTDAQGIARVGVPVGGQNGGFIATAVASKGSASATGSFAYAVSYPALNLSALRLNPSPLSVGGTATVAVTVQNGATAFAPPVTVTFASTCATAGKAVLGLPVLTVGGIASTSYVDKGCGAADPITASVTYGGITFSQTGTITTLGTTAGQIAFVSALPQNIALKGTGGPGRQESSVITFKVLDQSGKAVPGVNVSFGLSGSIIGGTGGITVSPASAVSTADGTVTTTVFAGTVNTPIRILATIVGSSPIVTTLSDQLVISTGIPTQRYFSLSTATFNVEGANFDACVGPPSSMVRVSMADNFGNPVPDGTAVSFTAEGGTIGASCLTGLVDTQLTDGSVIKQKGVPGECSVRFCSSNPRLTDGRATILAYALGEESYVENPLLPNSINRYDAGETFEDLCEPVRIDRAISNVEANINNKDSKLAACLSPTVGEVYIDSNGSGSFNATGDGAYNGVLNVDPATGQTTANNRISTVHVRGALIQVMSSSAAAIDAIGTSSLTLSKCVDGVAFVNTPQTITFAIRDTNGTVFPGNPLSGNIMPAGTQIEVSTSNGTIVSGVTSSRVPNTSDPSYLNWIYTFRVESDATQTGATGTPPYICTNTKTNGVLSVKVTSPMGIITTRQFDVSD
jgi:hypothetical protein